MLTQDQRLIIRPDDEKEHHLRPLLAPQSMALVGASTRSDTAGNDMVLEVLESGFAGPAYAVNPNYTEVEGLDCHATLTQLPERVDLVVIAVGNAQIESVLDEAISLGIPAAVIFGSAHLEGDQTESLRERLQDKARRANMPICGANCLGFYNLDHQVRAFPQHISRDFQPGGVSYISQSGSVLTSLLWNNQKLRFNLAISAGAELVTDVADYMDYALDQATTRVIALFLETVRRPQAFIAALQKALQRRIPVVVLKVGRTEASAALAISHSGAIAGDDAAYQALFEKYGVVRVSSLDELAATAQIFSMPREIAPGGVAAILDSGGEREILMDLADEADVPFSRIDTATVAKLEQQLEPGLEAINPLDAWGTGNNHKGIYEHCWRALMDDPDTGIGVFVADLTSRFWLHETFARVCRRVAMRTSKPIVMMTNHVGTESQDLALRLCKAGIQVLDGTQPGLVAIRNAMSYRDFLNQANVDSQPTNRAIVASHWRSRFAEAAPLDEYEGLQLLADYGIPAQHTERATTLQEVRQAAAKLDYPLVLKTAMPGIVHKSDLGGVVLNINNMEELEAAYADLRDRLGAKVILANMATGNVELALGIVSDPQFGPMVMVASGGIFIEILKDRQLALAPVDINQAHNMISRLAIKPMLDGARGQAASNLDSVAQALVNCAGIQVLDGTQPGLVAIRNAMSYRDFLNQANVDSQPTNRAIVASHWRSRFAEAAPLDEYEGLQLLADYGIPAQHTERATTLQEVRQAAAKLDYPLVLKTAMPGIVHKSDLGGVVLNINNMEELEAAYADLRDRLGAKVILANMATGNVELALGIVSDPQFGPMVMVASGGIFIEILKDRQLALAPVDINQAHNMISRLAIKPMLDGARGQAASNLDSVAQALVNLSVLASELGDYLMEMDVNPVKVGPDGCIAVDALVVTRPSADQALPNAT